ncbi:O-linked N-acetylglucosamine transferase family protein [Gemmobacter serpentinus]|uniref:O-linked N-acetylglucosamine transferase family protein n=1 Tax=Gemmobacter serpentinus TaxID=2652247 RepID=UPI00124CCF5C|nr:tetratricopeptide repeat protein [Gemmobacter serpentinus]
MASVRLTPAEEALAAAQYALVAGDKARAATTFAEARRLGAPLKLLARPYALCLSDLDRHAEAIEALRPWFEKNRKDPATVNLMGVLLKRAGRLTKAREVLELARKLRPQDLSPWQNLGNVHEMLGDHAKAAASFQGALKIDPKSAELWRLLARQHLSLGNPDAAIDALRRALTLAPGNVMIAALLVQSLQRAGRINEAQDLVTRLRQTMPDNVEFAVIEARLAYRSGDAARAETLLEQVLADHPAHLNASLQMATVLGDGDRRRVNAVLSAAVAAHPDNAVVLERLMESLSRSRYDSEAAHIETSYTLAKRLMDRFPSFVPEAARSLRTILMRVLDEDRMAKTGSLQDLLQLWRSDAPHSAMHYELGQAETLEDRLRLVDWHRDWGRRASRNITPVALPAAPAQHLARKLRIGFMSSDLRHHPITYFTLPLLEGYDRDRVEVFCYSFCERPADQVQQMLTEKVTGFRHWLHRPDAQIAEGIAADNLDILFELGGSTAMNRLEVMAHRPARLGASWLGYPHSAGLEQIDLILTDPYIRPEDPRLLIERPFEMPQTWVALSRMFAGHQIAEGTPQARKGHLTFGTANNPYKYTAACLDAWAAVLRAVPGSRFVFLRPEGSVDSFVTNSRAAFARRDVDPDRLDFIGVRGDHMRHYNEIDIALDSLPHVGGTTTCEALWMGVPTISLVGPGFPERLSYSNLSNAGLGDLAVFTVADYVAKAAELAADPARRLALRHGLRAQIAAHPLGQPERFTADFYDLAAKVAAQ